MCAKCVKCVKCVLESCVVRKTPKGSLDGVCMERSREEDVKRDGERRKERKKGKEFVEFWSSRPETISEHRSQANKRTRKENPRSPKRDK